MLHFDCDYMEGAHPLILERLVRTNMEQTPGYGLDPYCESARERIRQACGCTDAAVHFLVGGTQTNATVIDGILRPWEGVLAHRRDTSACTKPEPSRPAGTRSSPSRRTTGKSDPTTSTATSRPSTPTPPTPT